MQTIENPPPTCRRQRGRRHRSNEQSDTPSNDEVQKKQHTPAASAALVFATLPSSVVRPTPLCRRQQTDRDPVPQCRVQLTVMCRNGILPQLAGRELRPVHLLVCGVMHIRVKLPARAFACPPAKQTGLRRASEKASPHDGKNERFSGATHNCSSNILVGPPLQYTACSFAPGF